MQHDLFDGVKCNRDDEDAEQGGSEHSANNDGAHGLPGDRARTGGKPEWNATEHEGKRSHEDRTKTDASAGECSVSKRFPFFIFGFSKLDDQDRVLSGQPDEHDESNLGIDVVLKVARE